MFYDMFGNAYDTQEAANAADAAYSAGQSAPSGGTSSPSIVSYNADGSTTWSDGSVTPASQNTGGDSQAGGNGATSTQGSGGSTGGDTGTPSTGELQGMFPGTSLSSLTGMWNSLKSTTGLSTSQLLGLGAGAATLLSSLSQPAYNPKTPSQLLAMQPSNTPKAFTADQMAAFSQPLKAGNQLARLPAGNMPSSIVQGVDIHSAPQARSGALTQAAPYQSSTVPASIASAPLQQAIPGSGGMPVTQAQVSPSILSQPLAMADGGAVPGALTQAQPFSGYVQGSDGGQSDLIDAKLSTGEYVFDADSVANIGDGNNAAGAAKLDQLREQLRSEKRSAPAGQIPPPTGALSSYMKGGKV